MRERLDVFPLQAGDEGLDQLLADLFGNPLLLAPSQHQIVQATVARRRTEELDQELDTLMSFLSAGFEETVEPVAFAEQGLQREHDAPVVT